MARTISYNALPIPEVAPSYDAIAPHFTAMRRLALPGILLPDASMDNLGPILTAFGLTKHSDTSLIQHKNGHGDQGLHLDALPSDASSVGMVVQETRKGGADVVLAKLADPFCRELTKRNAHIDNHNYHLANFDLPPDTEALLNEGLVDPDVLDPAVYVGSVAAGGAIMFTFGGPNPIAHGFHTNTAERVAQGYIYPFTRL